MAEPDLSTVDRSAVSIHESVAYQTADLFVQIFMAEPPPRRQVALAHQPFHGVLDLATGDHLSLHQFIGEGDYGDLIEKRRIALEHDLLEGKVRFVCQQCHKPMVLRSMAVGKEREDRFFLKHRYRNEECAGTQGMTQEAICAMVYANTKESQAHKGYKTLIEASLLADPTFTETRQEATWRDIGGVRWRKPGIQTIRGGQRLAMEVQLSTTFVNVIAQRQAFYSANDGHLLWFFRDLSIRDFRQAEDDVFYNNNRNAFQITDETVELSQRERRFALECAWLEPNLAGDTITDQEHRRVVFFDQLQFDVKEERIPRAYYFDYDAARAPLDAQVEARRPAPLAGQHTNPAALPQPVREPVPPMVDYQADPALRTLMEDFMRGYPNHVNNQDFWSVLRARFKRRGFNLPEHIRFDPVFPVLQAAYSAKLGRPVGCEQQYLIQLANTLFNSHKPALRVFSAMMSHYDRGALLLERGDRKAWSDKVRQYHRAWINGDPAYLPSHRYQSLLEFLFPEAVEALREDPVSYVGRRRNRGGEP